MYIWCINLAHKVKKIQVLYHHYHHYVQKERKYLMTIFGINLIKYDIF
jgi:hypothetical protein